MNVFDGDRDDGDGNGHHDDEATLFVTNVLNGTVGGGGQIVNEGTAYASCFPSRKEHLLM